MLTFEMTSLLYFGNISPQVHQIMSTQKWPLKNIQDGIFRTLRSREINKTKRGEFFLFRLGCLNAQRMSLHIFIFWNTLIILKQKSQKWRLETKKIIDENENVKIDNGWLSQYDKNNGLSPQAQMIAPQNLTTNYPNSFPNYPEKEQKKMSLWATYIHVVLVDYISDILVS